VPIETNRKLARELYDLFNQGRLEEAARLATDDVIVDVVPFGMTFEGPEGLSNFMGGFKTAFPDLTITVTHQVASEDGVVSECTWAGTHTGELMTPSGPIPPTGKSVSGARFCEVWDVEDGKLSKLVNYQDVATWLRQLDLAE
jgi:steroid delta-isomerase-like uncharacterized protein